MMIPRQVTVHRSENIGHSIGRASRVPRYDQAMSGVFPYFIYADAYCIDTLSSKLSGGFSEGEYGPFWPSFASMNSGDASGNKVLWFSQAGLECITRTAGPGFLFHVENRAADLIEAEMQNY